MSSRWHRLLSTRASAGAAFWCESLWVWGGLGQGMSDVLLEGKEMFCWKEKGGSVGRKRALLCRRNGTRTEKRSPTKGSVQWRCKRP